MTFDLKNVRQTKEIKPPRIVLYGTHKIGKSTWASKAEKPIFIQTEDGLESIDAESPGLCQSWADVMGWITTLYTTEHDYKTVVIDSGDWAEKLLHKQVLKIKSEEDGKSYAGIESIGYGKGYTLAAEMFKDRFLEALNALRNEKGMQVIVICHVEIKTFNDPLSESYDRYQIKIHKSVAKLLQEWADVIGFAQQEAATKIEEGKGFTDDRVRVLDTQQRVIKLRPNAAFDAGNRYGLPDSLPLDYAVFAKTLKEIRNG